MSINVLPLMSLCLFYVMMDSLCLVVVVYLLGLFFNVVLYLVTLIIIYGWLKLNLVLNLSFLLMVVGLDSGWF